MVADAVVSLRHRVIAVFPVVSMCGGCRLSVFVARCTAWAIAAVTKRCSHCRSHAPLFVSPPRAQASFPASDVFPPSKRFTQNSVSWKRLDALSVCVRLFGSSREANLDHYSFSITNFPLWVAFTITTTRDSVTMAPRLRTATSKTPEGRSATFRVQGLVFPPFFTFFFFFFSDFLGALNCCTICCNIPYQKTKFLSRFGRGGTPLKPFFDFFFDFLREEHA